MLRLALAMTFLSSAAFAQSYLPQTNLATAQARSNQTCVAQGCDGVQTLYWWQAQELTDGTAVLVIQPSGSYSSAQLTGTEQLALVTATALGTKIPTVISEPAFMARFTAGQIAAMNASVDPAVSVPWANVKGTATTNLASPTVQAMLTAAIADGIIPGWQNFVQPAAVP